MGSVSVPALEATEAMTIAGDQQPESHALALFLIGTVIGAIAGAVAGTLLSNRTRALLLGLIELTGRDLSDRERERLKFEILAQ